MSDTPSPILPADEAALGLARKLLSDARSGALAVLHPDDGRPHVSRVAITLEDGVGPLTLVSALALHTRALAADPRAALLLGDVGPKGDAMAQPRMTLAVAARFVRPDSEGHAALRALWLSRHPKAKLWVDLGDFAFARLTVLGCDLNAGFGRAHVLTPADLGLPAA